VNLFYRKYICNSVLAPGIYGYLMMTMTMMMTTTMMTTTNLMMIMILTKLKFSQ